MKRLKKMGLYASFVILAYIFFLFVLFPSDLAKDYIVFKGHQMIPGLVIKIETLKLHFPLSLHLEKTHLYYANTSFFFDRLSLRPALLPLFKRELLFFVQGQTYRGHLEGTIVRKPNSSEKSWLLDVRLHDIQLNQLPWIGMLAPTQLSGKLNGRIQAVFSSNQELNASGEIWISECLVKTKLPLLENMDLQFDEIESVFSLKRSLITLQKTTAVGKQIHAELHGTLECREPLEKSRLDLNARILLQPRAFEQVQDANTKEFMKLIKNDFSIKIYGLLGALEYSLNSPVYLN